MGKQKRWATAVLARMKEMKAHGIPLTIQTLADDAECHYEHMRKLLAGLAPPSKEHNEAVAKTLKLDADELWRMSQEDRMMKKFGRIMNLDQIVPKPMLEMMGDFSMLSPEQQEGVKYQVHAMAMATGAPTARPHKRKHA